MDFVDLLTAVLWVAVIVAALGAGAAVAAIFSGDGEDGPDLTANAALLLAVAAAAALLVIAAVQVDAARDARDLAGVFG